MFTVARLRTALLRTDPDTADPPLSRTTRGAVFSVIVVILIAAGALVLGLLRPTTGDAWRSPGTLVLEKETGSRYLYLDGTLRPVLNHTSVLLLTGTDPQRRQVPRKALASISRGAPVGIVGAPDAPPRADALTVAPWQVCATTGDTGVEVAVQVGGTPAGVVIGDDRAVLAATADGTVYLLWRGTRMRVPAGRGVPAALGLAARTPRAVSETFLDALPAGPDLVPPEISGRGRVIGGVGRVGQVFAVSADQYFVLRADGLVPLTAVTAALVLGDPGTAAAYPGGVVAPLPLTAALLQAHRSNAVTPLASSDAAAGYPTELPQAAGEDARAPLCVRIEPRGTNPVTRLVVGTPGPSAGQPVAALPGVGVDCRVAQRVAVPPAGGALVRALPAAGTAGNTLYLVTEPGVKYPVPAGDAVERLGYRDVTPVALPAGLLALLPTGPALDPAFAAHGSTGAVAGCDRQDATKSTA